MSVYKTWFQKGKPTNPATKTTTLLKYLPRPRSPKTMYTFRRENLIAEDLEQQWNHGRMKDGPHSPRSPYNLKPSHTIEGDVAEKVPKAELEKFMPNIAIGPKAYVTPVSIMSARAGHRVTHDLLHSYDKYIGQLEKLKPAEVDHDNITPYDKNRVGLNADTIGCRSRIYRWLRRPVQAQETWYYSRSTLHNGIPVVSEAEMPLHKKIIRLARSDQLKAACEEYRKLNYIPPTEVFRALTSACVAGGLIADAVAIFEDGMRLKYMTRDAEVFRNLMRTAINANHVARVMWVHSLMRGDFHFNVYARTEIAPLQQYEINAMALEFLLDNERPTEARIVFEYLQEADLLSSDLNIRAGSSILEKLKNKETVNITSATLADLDVAKDALNAAKIVAKALRERFSSEELSVAPQPDQVRCDGEWLNRVYPDVDVAFVLRLSRFQNGDDLMASDIEAFTDRALTWLEALSDRSRQMSKPLPYLSKSKVTPVSDNVFVVSNAAKLRRESKLLPHEEGASFNYVPNARFVEQTYPSLNMDIPSQKYLARQPVQREVDPFQHFEPMELPRQQLVSDVRPRVLHPSISATRDRSAQTGGAVVQSQGAQTTDPRVKAAPDARNTDSKSDTEKMEF